MADNINTPNETEVPAPKPAAVKKKKYVYTGYDTGTLQVGEDTIRLYNGAEIELPEDSRHIGRLTAKGVLEAKK